MNSKILLTLGVIACILTACGNSQRQEILDTPISENIRINQLGYFPDLAKKFYLADSDAGTFMLCDTTGKVVFEGDLEAHGVWESSGEDLKSGDFSAFKETGSYFIHVPGTGNSYSFEIKSGLYDEAAVAALRTFYFMRTGMEMEEKYLGEFARPMGHPDDTCYFHPSSGISEGFMSSPKGWYDAGDYGKYVVNAAITTGTMLAFYELYPGYFPDASLNIPESGNGISDLLDEIRYELDWVLTMQDEDGGVFHKLTSLWHDGITMPHETFSKRFIIGKSTAASLDFAAMMAQASRVYREVDPAFADRSLEAARKAYEWALDNPDRYFRNPKGVGTGGYGDHILDEEFFWAAAELYATTGENDYYEAIKDKIGDISFRLEESWRNYVDNIGYYSLLSSGILSKQDEELLEQGILTLADELMNTTAKNAYDIPVSRFVWGSNSDILNTTIVLLYAHHISGDQKYLDAAVLETDYIFGKNATAYSYVSEFGSKSSRNFHHRLLWADDNDACFPGFIAGGPNFQMHDRQNLAEDSIFYPDTIGAKAYIDDVGSYASNEVCINWNAPLVFVLAYIDQVSK